MNKTRRKQLSGIVDNLRDLMDELESVKNEEQEAFDNMPEGLQYSERGEVVGINIDSMDDAVSSLSDVIDALTEIIEQ